MVLVDGGIVYCISSRKVVSNMVIYDFATYSLLIVSQCIDLILSYHLPIHKIFFKNMHITTQYVTE